MQHSPDITGDSLRVLVNVVPVEAQDAEPEHHKAALPLRVELPRGSTCVPFLAVHLDDDSELRVCEVDAGDELVTVVDLVLGHWARKASSPQ